MDRRDFIRLAGAGVAAGTTQASMAARQSAPAQSARPAPQAAARMKVGTQHDSSDEVLGVLAALGVRHICSRLPSVRLDDQWSADGLQRLRERVEAFGITLDMVPLPMSSNPIARAENPNILLGKSPERDREIDDICQMIRNAAKAGIPSLKYNLTLLGVVRTSQHAGSRRRPVQHVRVRRGHAGSAADRGRGVDADAYWERITYFLERVIPVATEYQVRMACHPQDPGMPPGKGYQGVETVLGSVDGPEALRGDCPEPVSRAQLLPGYGVGDARRTRARRSSTSSATSARAERSSTCTSAISAAASCTSRRRS